MMRTPLAVADLFCGGGGTSTGLAQACANAGRKFELLAINHWNIAVQTHALNHPWARHLCASLDQVNPRTEVPRGVLDLLLASPECTDHSVAKGGRPKNDQRRASAWLILKWLQELYVKTVIIENVPEFRKWGPLGADGKPLKSKRGETFRAFLQALNSLGYNVDYRVLCAANYGAATTRERLFMIARRGHRKITWPEQTHAPADRTETLFGNLKSWRPAREIIDWSIKGTSIFNRKRPLAPATLERIAAGMLKFNWPEPFLVVLRQHMAARSLDVPLPTLTAGGLHVGLVEPFVLGQQSCAAPRGVSSPLPTISTGGAISLVEPFVIPFFGERKGQSPRVHSIGDPLPTVTSHGAGGLVQPFIMPVNHGSRDKRTYSLERPFPTVTSVDAWARVEPFVVKYNGTGTAYGLDEPLDTVTAKDRFGLVTPDGFLIDVLFRMLQPHELAAAMSFPPDYQFAGTREQKVMQIGNAVDVRQARALIAEVLAA